MRMIQDSMQRVELSIEKRRLVAGAAISVGCALMLSYYFLVCSAFLAELAASAM